MANQQNRPLIPEIACQGGPWKPSKSTGDNVVKGETLGQITFSGISCNVVASVPGKIKWILKSSQVVIKKVVCRIEPLPPPASPQLPPIV